LAEQDLTEVAGVSTIKFFFLYFLLNAFLENPLAALVLLVVGYAIIDRWYIGALPDFVKPLRTWNRTAKLKRELEFSPSPGQLLYELGALQVASGNMTEGRQNLEKAHNLIPEHADIEFWLGVARIRTGELESGKAALEAALKLNPKIQYGFPYVYLIEYSLKRKEPEQQIAEYLEKIDENGNPRMYYELGIIYQQEGYPEKAGEMFREARLSFRNSPSFLRKQQRYYAIMAKVRGLLLR
jgi:tetratricopeptide (TPR) repeat protein